MGALFGTATACAALGAAAALGAGEPHAPWLLAGALLYLVGTVALTIAYHVPRNEGLATVDPSAPDAARRWARYLRNWTRWNHLRTATALAAGGLLIAGMSAG